MARDYYAEARELARDARAAELPALGSRIDAVIADGFTASEILMGLRATLRDELPELEPFPELEARAASLLGAIDAALAS